MLMADYAQHTEEIRDLLKSMDLNMQIAVVMLAAIIGVAFKFDGGGFLADEKVLAALPTVIFFFGMVHLIKTGSANVHGAHRNVLAVHIREVAGDQELLLWGDLKNTSDKRGLVQIGFYFVFGIIAVIYGVSAWLVFREWSWTAYLHVGYLVTIIVYGAFAMSLNTDGPRGAEKRQRDWEASHANQSADA